jgi:hypothetical protein
MTTSSSQEMMRQATIDLAGECATTVWLTLERFIPGIFRRG